MKQNQMNPKGARYGAHLRGSLLVLLTGSLALFDVSEATAQTTPAPMPGICTRACWGARASCSMGTLPSLTRAIIHHTAGTGDYTTSFETGKARVRGIQNFHMDNMGWCDIGYHFLVNAGGHIYEGLNNAIPGWPRGAHDCANDRSMGFNMMGYFHPPYNQQPTTAQRNGLYDVIAWKMPSGWNPKGFPPNCYNLAGGSCGTACKGNVGSLDGHREVIATACPGDVAWQYITLDPYGGEARNSVSARRTPSGKTPRDVDNSHGGFSVTGTWSTGSSAVDKFGPDYRFRSTAPVSEPAQWATTLNVTATWTVRAWWSQGSNRSTSAPYVVQHDAGSTTVSKNQQTGGGAWQTLGAWTMGGAKIVKLSCWTSTGYVVVADAIRWE